MADGEVIGIQVAPHILAERIEWQELMFAQFSREQKAHLPLDKRIEDLWKAESDDREWFLARPGRRTRIRAFSDRERLKYPKLDPETYLMVLDRVRPLDQREFFGYEAVAQLEDEGHVVVSTEAFKVPKAEEELTIYAEMEAVVGSEIFDKGVGAWLMSQIDFNLIAKDCCFGQYGGNQLRFEALHGILERLCPGSMQVVWGSTAPLA